MVKKVRTCICHAKRWPTKASILLHVYIVIYEIYDREGDGEKGRLGLYGECFLYISSCFLMLIKCLLHSYIVIY